jgi:hypothetical protein
MTDEIALAFEYDIAMTENQSRAPESEDRFASGDETRATRLPSGLPLCRFASRPKFAAWQMTLSTARKTLL